MNKAILVGRLTKDPELKMTENTKRRSMSIYYSGK